jgi:glutaredoxin 3
MPRLETGRHATHIACDRITTLSFRRTPLTDTPQGASAPVITLYSSAICPYCMAAKNFLKSKGQTWNEVRIDLDPAEREKMIAKANRTSVPQIFIGDVHVGGYDDMIALHRAGKLEPLLAGASA